ncbi:hypothetical protein [Tenuifilum osseticum]|uniref:hypothetical protein n=1 Tax=Tenuifilum osseticum TaxID=3374723 RepID=UPI0034E3D990
MEIYFVFFFPPTKEENPTHIAHIAKAPQANAPTKGLQKSFRLSNPSNRLSGRF